MEYFKFGKGEEPLMILPGLSVQSVMGFASAMEEAYQVLTEDYILYLIDRRKDLPEVYSVHDMAEDTAEALKALGLDEVNLFGASQGGMMAMDMAISHPEMVKALILGSIACPVLVLGSYDDQVVGGEASEMIADLLKGKDCTLYMYDGYGHAPYDLAPDYKERMLEFLR